MSPKSRQLLDKLECKTRHQKVLGKLYSLLGEQREFFRLIYSLFPEASKAEVRAWVTELHSLGWLKTLDGAKPLGSKKAQVWLANGPHAAEDNFPSRTRQQTRHALEAYQSYQRRIRQLQTEARKQLGRHEDLKKSLYWHMMEG